jgi:hypothetical protein
MPNVSETLIPVAVPTVHLNGTSRAELERQLEAAATAVRDAIVTVGGAAPNARDYYPQGDDAFRVAARQHAGWLVQLGDILTSLETVRASL